MLVVILGEIGVALRWERMRGRDFLSRIDSTVYCAERNWIVRRAVILEERIRIVQKNLRLDLKCPLGLFAGQLQAREQLQGVHFLRVGLDTLPTLAQHTRDGRCACGRLLLSREYLIDHGPRVRVELQIVCERHREQRAVEARVQRGQHDAETGSWTLKFPEPA